MPQYVCDRVYRYLNCPEIIKESKGKSKLDLDVIKEATKRAS